MSFKNLLLEEWPGHRQSHLSDVIGCSIGVYNFISSRTASNYSIIVNR